MRARFHPKQKRHLFRILLTFVLTAFAMVLTALFPFSWWQSLLLIVPIYLYIGYDVLWAAITDIGHGQIFGEKFLMALATIGALALSEYLEAVAVLLFFQVGELFESVANASARQSLAALASLCPDEATVLSDDDEIILPIDEIEVGAILSLKVGDRVPLDCKILTGEATLDFSSLTGEALPVLLSVGDYLPAGTVLLDAPLTASVEKRAEESATARILDMMEDALAEKGAHERFMTKFSHIYTPAVVFSAIALALLYPFFSELSYLAALPEGIRRALAFLVVSCPCALVISLPLSFFSASGRAARQGIIFKSNAAIERLASAKIACFDKTGTLTNGRFSLIGIEKAPDCRYDDKSLTTLAAALEKGSNHPLAAAFVGFFPGTVAVSSMKEIRGRGVEGDFQKRHYHLGSHRFLREEGVANLPKEQDGTALYLAEDRIFLAAFLLADTPKENAASLATELQKQKIDAVILSGDRHETVATLSQTLGFSAAYGSLLPEEKLEKITALKERGTVVFAGDGINDAPSMAAADVSFAMGALGSDAAIEAADAVICDDKPEKVAFAIMLSRFTMRLVKENLYGSIALKLAILLLSTLGYGNLWLAIFADVGLLILATLNAMRALTFQNRT